MSEDVRENRDASVAGTIERVRLERYPDLDRDLVLEILRLHADGAPADNLARSVDEAIARRAEAV